MYSKTCEKILNYATNFYKHKYGNSVLCYKILYETFESEKF